MNEEGRSESLSQNIESTDRKRWQTPELKVFAINQTKGDFIAVNDDTSFFS
jgi:hypothetical protein